VNVVVPADTHVRPDSSIPLPDAVAAG